MVIESPRLLIRPFALSDAPAAFSWFRDPEVMEHIPYGPDSSLTQTRERLVRYITHFENYGFSKYIIVEKASGTPLGDAGLMHLEGTPFVELGFRIRRSSWRQGFATEAGRAILEYAFEILRMPQVHAIVETDNATSRHIIEKRLNFAYIGDHHFFGLPMRLYRRDQRDFPARSQSPDY